MSSGACTESEGPYQTAQIRSLISALAVRCQNYSYHRIINGEQRPEDVNPHILRKLKGTFSLESAYMCCWSSYPRWMHDYKSGLRLNNCFLLNLFQKTGALLSISVVGHIVLLLVVYFGSSFEAPRGPLFVIMCGLL